MNGADASRETAMGFAGLAALATTLPPEPRFTKEAPKKPANDGAARAAASDARTVANPTFWTAGRRWAAAGAGVAVVVGLAYWPRDGATQRAPASSAVYAPTTAYAPTQPSYRPPAVTQDQFVETKPAAGGGQVLSRNEIRYCLSEKVRMEAMSDYVDATRRLHIERFNALVGDYNARCSNYRYRQSDMNSASASVDAAGDRLRAQAATTVGQWR